MNEIVPVRPNVIQTFDDVTRVSTAMAASGYFSDSKQAAQAIVKVMAGHELGIGPFASMTGIHIIQGKPAIGANILAALVKNDPRYNYQVEVCDNTACALNWSENGKPSGQSSFTIEEAKAAGLTGKDNWKKYPSDMLFARAISRGARRYAPGIFGGAPVYTPDELGADVDEEGQVIPGEWTDPEPVPEPTPAPVNDSPPKQTKNGNGKPAGIVQALVDAQLSENTIAAATLLNDYIPADVKKEGDDAIIAWAKLYRAHRDTDKTPQEAAALATSGDKPA